MSTSILLTLAITTVTVILTGCTPEPIQPPPTASATEVSPTFTPTIPSPTPTEQIPPTITPTAAPVEVTKNILYIPDSGVKHKLDIYIPNLFEPPHPTILMIHAGGGTKEQLAFWARTFAEKGYAAISINHRGTPDFGNQEMVSDTFCALAWLHSNKDEYGLDANNIYAMGHSEGGTLVTMLGVADNPTLFLENCPHTMPTEDWIQGVAAFTGIFDYVSFVDSTPAHDEYVIMLFGDDQQRWIEGSPINAIDGREPPFLLIHGANDNTILPSQSRTFAEALETAGVSVQLHIIPGGTHQTIAKSDESMKLVEEFLASLTDQP